MKIFQIKVKGIILFYQESESESIIVPVYQTIQGAIEQKSESAGVLMNHGEVISLGKHIGWVKKEETQELSEEMVEDIRKKLEDAKGE